MLRLQNCLALQKYPSDHQIIILAVLSRNEWRGPSPRLSAWATQLRRHVAAVASRRRHSDPFDRPGNRTPNLRTDSDDLTVNDFFHSYVKVK